MYTIYMNIYRIHIQHKRILSTCIYIDIYNTNVYYLHAYIYRYIYNTNVYDLYAYISNPTRMGWLRSVGSIK